MTRLLVVGVMLLGCKGKSPYAGGGSGSSDMTGSAAGSTAGSNAVVAGSSADPSTPPPSAEPAGGPATDLPLASDVLPRDEATPNTRVVTGDGFRYLIPQDFSHADGNAYTGTVEGFASAAPLTFAASSEPFTGSLDDLVAREAKGEDAANVGPVMVQVAGAIKQGYAKRFTHKVGDRMELATLVVHNGKAYVLRCSTPNVSNAWANVGSDCITRSTTFHIAPPPLTKQTPPNLPAGGPPPVTEGVTYLGSKVKGVARKKADVNDWLDSATQYLKPCIASAPAGSTWKVSFEIGADGKAAKTSAETGTDAFGPADATSLACLDKAVSSLDIGSKATGVEPVTVILVHQ